MNEDVPLTEDMMDLQALVGKSPDADFLRDMICFAARWLMEMEVGGLTGAAYDEKYVERLAQRNGYRDRDWETRAGTAELGIPSCESAVTSLDFLNPGGWPRRR